MIEITKFISDVEEKKYFDKKNQNIMFVLFDKFCSKLSYFLTLPNYNKPNYDLRNEVVIARENFFSKSYNINRTNIYNTEILKILYKIDLSFGHAQINLLLKLVKQLHENNSSLLKYKYISLFMPIVHLSNDVIEKTEIKKDGSFHTDRDSQFGFRGSKVLWMPFTDYEYEGIATKIGSQEHFIISLVINLAIQDF